MMNPLVTKIGRVTPHWVIGLATGWYLLTHQQATVSLAVALGATGILWQAAISIFHLAVGVIGLWQRNIRALHVNGWLHIACATVLLGYGLAILLTPATQPAGVPPVPEHWWNNISTTVGLIIAAVFIHLLRWRQIEDEQIPGIRAARNLAANTAAAAGLKIRDDIAER